MSLWAALNRLALEYRTASDWEYNALVIWTTFLVLFSCHSHWSQLQHFKMVTVCPFVLHWIKTVIWVWIDVGSNSMTELSTNPEESNFRLCLLSVTAAVGVFEDNISLANRCGSFSLSMQTLRFTNVKVHSVLASSDPFQLLWLFMQLKDSPWWGESFKWKEYWQVFWE